MDRLRSASEAARELGTNTPRLLRHARRLGLRLEKRAVRGVERYVLTDAQVDELRLELGALRPTGELSRIELQVLAALASAPRGLLSERAVARRAHVSPTAAAHALDTLERSKLVSRERTMIALGKAHEAQIIRARPEAKAWAGVAEAVASVRLPASKPRAVRRVPQELRHLFWNTAPSQLDLDHAGGYIARRLIQTNDLDGLAWGAEHLKPSDWRHAAMTRGLEPRQRALAENLAEAGKR